MSKPLCFMVMPFGTKKVVPAIDGAPKQIDFDALWIKALKPAIETLGYEAHRADQDTGALIVHEMLERLFHSNLVIADMTLPNGNVYYEIGIRHAARPTGCVLIGAEWARPLFDTRQMRRLTYPLEVERVNDQAAGQIKTCLVQSVPELARGRSPMEIALPGYPNPDPQGAVTMRQAVAAARELEAKIDAVRSFLPGTPKKDAARELAASNPPVTALSVGVAMAIVITLRDADLWDEMRDYLQALPIEMSESPWMQQQLALARSKAKSSDHELAIASLQQLIRKEGDNSESRGLIGGRYKKLADRAKALGDMAAHRQYLERAIAAYEAGMQLDLGGYYPVSNLARLYRERGGQGDSERAEFALKLTQEACEALRVRNDGDDWLRQTLLGAAFDRGDYANAEKLTLEVEIQGPALWQLESTINDLRRSVAQIESPGERSRFEALIDRLQARLNADKQRI
jgi:hypothetical protein